MSRIGGGHDVSCPYKGTRGPCAHGKTSPAAVPKRREISSLTKTVSDGAEVSHPQADAFIPQKARDGEECAGANAENKIGLLRSIPQRHPGYKLRKGRVGVTAANAA
jgi:hypothetical protein